MKFINLTYYRPENQYGGTAGATTKTFLCNMELVERITQYKDSTKISMYSGKDIEVVESKNDILRLVVSESYS